MDTVKGCGSRLNACLPHALVPPGFKSLGLRDEQVDPSTDGTFLIS